MSVAADIILAAAAADDVDGVIYISFFAVVVVVTSRIIHTFVSLFGKAIDWNELAANNFYFTPARQTRDVGKYIAEMIDYMCKERGADIRKFHLIGHSLGAHTVGYAGMYTTSGRIPRITGTL